MDLIDKEKTLHDLTTFLRQKWAGADTRIFFGILEVVEKQEAWIKLHGSFQYMGAILAPCPRCGSFEVEVTTRRISDPDSIFFNQFEGCFRCPTCGNEFRVRSSFMPYIFTEWNRFCKEEIKRKVANNGESKMH